MPVDCQRSTSGGKGNLGMFIERDSKICAAGLPSAQPDDRVQDSLEHYLLKDETDALISDAIIPPPKPRPLPPLRKPIPLDMRYAGPFSAVPQLVNPPVKTKFQTLVEDFKDNTYKSYWKRPLGKVPGPVQIPEGLDTFGKQTAFHGRLYDIVMPKEPYPDKTPLHKIPGVQKNRDYCSPPFNPNLIYGHRTYLDKRGTQAKCCVTDDRIIHGNGNVTIINSMQCHFQDAKQPRIGAVLSPNDNLSSVPTGYSFGKLKPPDNLPECLVNCDINPDKDFLRKCLKHLNSLRKSLSKRFLPNFFHSLYLSLKYFDKDKSGWLPKDTVYRFCGTKLIRFDPSLIEPLLSMWQAFDGSRVEYKTFIHVINYREPSPEIPKISDMPDECLDFRTTYTDMVKPGQEIDNRRMAGLPSGRYFDMDYPVTPNLCCKADRTCLLQESDVKSSLCPSVLTLMHVNHRDMYAKREPDVVRRVFEATGVKFSDVQFSAVWEEAKKYHSQGWVCYETFRKALESNPRLLETNEENKNE